jgi:hypothetical protein
MIAVALGPLAGEQQPVDPPCRVPASSPPAHLHKPGPHVLRGRVDGDRVVRHHDGVANDVIAGNMHRTLGTPLEP